ncbi:MAG: MFS transporter [Chloroflexi bacterium]|nr:MFS transporter [Chloroflexota bacterium]
MIQKTFPILAISIFIAMLGSGIVVPLLPLYAEGLGASGLWLGLVFASFPIARTLATPVFGRLSDRQGRKRYIAIGLLAYGIVSFGFIWVTSVPLLVMLRFLHGIAGASILPVAQAYVGDASPKGEEGKWMGYASAAFFSGFGFGPLMGGVVAEQLGMDTAFALMGALSLLAFVVAAIGLPEIRRTRSAAHPYPSIKEISRSQTMTGLFSIQISLTFGRAAFYTFLPILANRLGISTSLIGTLLAVNILMLSVLEIPSGRLADRFSRKALITIGCLASAAFLVALPSLGQSFGLLLVLAVAGALAGAIAVPAASAMAVEEGRLYGMGSIMALFSMAMSIGMAVGPIAAGAIADLSNVSFAFYFGATMILLGTGAFTWLTRQRSA